MRYSELKKKNFDIGVVGLGYVGLPLAVEFSKYFNVTGFDVNPTRVSELKKGKDHTNELCATDISQLKTCKLTDDPHDLKHCNVYIVTVPTPVDEFKVPDLSHLQQASKLIGQNVSRDNLVVFESTVYPGVTQKICVPIIEQYSKLKYNKDFFCGYSPERINPGDKKHSIKKIVKLVSGSTPQALELVKFLYEKIVDAGVHKTETIEIAEAAKVIENIQRDVNIALINEFAKIFEAIKLPTNDILNAASTKWNFLSFKPGLVGGHCIGVDPYYLTHLSNSIGQHPELISAARRINDGMSRHWALKFVKALQLKNDIDTNRILVLGATFKENCPDLRNTKVFEFVEEIENYGYEVDIYDPIADLTNSSVYSHKFVTALKQGTYAGVALLVAHDEFVKYGAIQIRKYCTNGGIIFDLKACLDQKDVDLTI